MGAIDISDPSKFKTKIKELGRSITTALTKLKTKLTPENMSSIKQQVNEFARQVIGAKENQTLRAALSEQLESVRKGLDKAIAAIPVNSPQRRTMLDARGTNNWARVQLAQAELRDNPKSVVAQAEYTRALDIMLRNPASTNLLRRSLDDAIKEKESAMYQEQDATKKRALAEELNGLMQKRTALQNIGKNTDIICKNA